METGQNCISRVKSSCSEYSNLNGYILRDIWFHLEIIFSKSPSPASSPPLFQVSNLHSLLHQWKYLCAAMKPLKLSMPLSSPLTTIQGTPLFFSQYSNGFSQQNLNNFNRRKIWKVSQPSHSWHINAQLQINPCSTHTHLANHQIQTHTSCITFPKFKPKPNP